jgi:DNA polymerase elongation subunit (family B)
MVNDFSIHFYPTDITYTVKNNKTVMLIFGRAVDGKLVCVLDYFKPYFYVLLKQGENLEQYKTQLQGLREEEGEQTYSIEEVHVERKKWKGKQRNVLKVVVNRQKALRVFREQLKLDSKVEYVLETRIPLTRKYMLNKGILPFRLHQVVGERTIAQVKADYLIRAKGIDRVEHPSKDVLQPRMLALSMETEQYAITTVHLTMQGKERVISWKKESADRHVGSEAELLTALKHVFDELRPDLIIGKGSDLALAHIAKKAEQYGMYLTLARDYSPLRAKQSMKLPGIPHIDLLHVQELFKPKETPQEQKKTLLEKGINSMPYLLEVSKLLCANVYDVSKMNGLQLLDEYMIKAYVEEGEIIPEKKYYQELQRNTSFFQYPPKGMYENLAVLDLALLPALLIEKHNICSTTCDVDCAPEEKRVVPNSSHWTCKRKGLLPQIMERLLSRRARVTALLKTREDPFLIARRKILNSMLKNIHSYVTFSSSRAWHTASAEVLETYMKHYTTEIVDLCKQQDITLLYADSESIILLGTPQSLRVLMDIVHERIGELELQRYKKGFFTEKKYALLGEYLALQGFDSKHYFTQKLTYHILTKLLKEGVRSARRCYQDHIAQVYAQYIPNKDMVITTTLQKPLDEYENVTPYVKVAKLLQSQGNVIGEGSVISYLVVRGEGSISERARLPGDVQEGKYDQEYYLNNHILPIMEKIFDGLEDEPMQDIPEPVNDKEQSRLTGFMDEETKEKEYVQKGE